MSMHRDTPLTVVGLLVVEHRDQCSGWLNAAVSSIFRACGAELPVE
jgi:hypothetical protein